MEIGLLICIIFGRSLGRLLLGYFALFEKFVSARGPGTWSKDLLDVFGEDDFALLEGLCEAVVPVLMKDEQFLGTLVLLGDDLGDLLVDNLGAFLTKRLGEAVLLARW